MTDQTGAADDPYEDEGYYPYPTFLRNCECLHWPRSNCYAFILRWDEAQRRARSKLKPNEKEKVDHFQTPEQLLEDLKQLTQEHKGSLTGQLIERMLPCFQIMICLYALLVASMPKEKIKITLLWGIFHIIVKVCNWNAS